MSIFMMSVSMLFFIIIGLAVVEGLDKFDKEISCLDKNKYSLKGIYLIGYSILNIIKFNPKSKNNAKRLNELYEVYGDREAEKNLTAIRAGQISYILLFSSISLTIATIAGVAELGLIGTMYAIILAYDLDRQPNKIIYERQQEIINNIPNVVSKLTLLVNSGCIFQDAWIKTANCGNGTLYEEMKRTIVDRENGYTAIEAYTRFSKRCGLKEINKFTSIIIQNMDKGGKELVEYLRELSKEMWNEKKHNSKIIIDKVKAKLMIPTFIVFIGILILVMLPMFMNMSASF